MEIEGLAINEVLKNLNDRVRKVDDGYGEIYDIEQAIEMLDNWDEPEWFDFDEFYDEAPIVGFHSGHAIILGADVPGDRLYEAEFEAIGPDYDGYWKT